MTEVSVNARTLLMLLYVVGGFSTQYKGAESLCKSWSCGPGGI